MGRYAVFIRMMVGEKRPTGSINRWGGSNARYGNSASDHQLCDKVGEIQCRGTSRVAEGGGRGGEDEGGEGKCVLDTVFANQSGDSEFVGNIWNSRRPGK